MFQKNCGYLCREVKKRPEFIHEGPFGFLVPRGEDDDVCSGRRPLGMISGPWGPPWEQLGYMWNQIHALGSDPGPGMLSTC